ncbi:zona pellucida sperm-binding protein 1-like [Electrophorus electricus]|uniref:Zona pellucida sperm-binding protein 4 n=1 Tax=Electrophorus electricus TaxID=8005 RepID=A0AAY5EJG4_ELEEL|nr:zona pellucida sperm-binding protein 1-like [Electrophorus electricus]XP_035380702.1 zona pellucida sperm-binding protein 1-like [Electrophorus electricus]XP_035380714.1 zona pellucida sperm-binding protein 1-like [Electrophorus electricus]
MARVWVTIALVGLCVFLTCWCSEAASTGSLQGSKQLLLNSQLLQLHVPQVYGQQQQLTTNGPSQKCNVDGSVKIACGEPGLNATHCEAINCCFDGQYCYYGRTVTVQCTRDGQFVLVVAKDATLPRLSLDSVSLLGENGPCGPVDSNAAFAIYQFPVTACGTHVMELGAHLVYENKMTSSYEVGMGPLGAITRDSYYELYFQCGYYAMSIGALTIRHYANDPPLPVVAPGPLRVELRIGNGQCATKGCVEVQAAYTSYYKDTDYPVVKVLREPVYVEVRILERSDPNIVLTLGHCWATSSPNPFSVPQWDLLVNGCPYKDDRYLTTLVPVERSPAVPFPTHYKRFVLKMFAFVDTTSMAPLHNQVYIHCSTAVCHPSATETCEPSCSRQRRHVPEEREAPPESAVVSSGGVVFIEMA